jgi:prolyl oligopeptidase
MAAAASGSLKEVAIAYPSIRADDTKTEFFGTSVADPFRWMEDVASAETSSFVKGQVALTSSYFETSGIAARSSELAQLLTKVWDYDRIYVPRQRGSAVFFSMKQGTREQPVLMKAASASPADLKAASVFMDTAAEFPGQAMALKAAAFTKDGSMFAYGLSKGGSDWFQVRVRRCADGVDLEDVVPWVRYSGITWRKDGAGFFYSRFAAVPGVHLPIVRQPSESVPAYEAADKAAAAESASVEAGTETAASKHQTVYYHELGTDPRVDRVVFAPEDPDW